MPSAFNGGASRSATTFSAHGASVDGPSRERSFSAAPFWRHFAQHLTVVACPANAAAHLGRPALAHVARPIFVGGLSVTFLFVAIQRGWTAVTVAAADEAALRINGLDVLSGDGGFSGGVQLHMRLSRRLSRILSCGVGGSLVWLWIAHGLTTCDVAVKLLLAAHVIASERSFSAASDRMPLSGHDRINFRAQRLGESLERMIE